MKALSLYAVFGLFAASATAQYQFLNLTTAQTNLSASCVNVLNSVISCDPSIAWVGRGRYEEDSTLQTVCTDACSFALTRWIPRVSGACTSRYVDELGNAYLPAYWVEGILENYNLLCQQNNGKFCNAVVRDAFGVNPVDQNKTKSAVATATCDDCFLKQIQTRLQMPLQSNPDLASTFKSLTSACKKTGFAVTPVATTTSWIISTTLPSPSVALPTSTTCVGTTYAIKSGDTCDSIATAQGLSTGGLIDANGLQAHCANLPKSGNLCIPTSAKCKTRTVKQGDTCAKVADQVGLTWVQIATWNPDFGSDCKRISNFTGSVMCVSTPGGNWVNPSPTEIESEPEITLPPFVGIDATLLPQPTMGGSINGSDIWTYTYAEGTRIDCDRYANVTDFGDSASCDKVATGFGVTTDNLVHWNPSLNASCVLDGKLSYCVQPSTLHVGNVTEYCSFFDTPDMGQTCDSFLAQWDIDYETFLAFNDGVGSKCENWKLGYTYCVAARHYRQAGIISTCTQWDTANVTNYASDPCSIFEVKWGIPHARFVGWNPMLQSDCSGIQLYNDYCVRIPNYQSVPQTRTTTRASAFINPLGDWWGPTPGVKANLLEAGSVSGSATGSVKVSATVTGASSVKASSTGSVKAASTSSRTA